MVQLKKASQPNLPTSVKLSALRWHSAATLLLPLGASSWTVLPEVVQLFQDDETDRKRISDLTVVTGRGNGSGPTGPVLQAGVPIILESTLGLLITPLES